MQTRATLTLACTALLAAQGCAGTVTTDSIALTPAPAPPPTPDAGAEIGPDPLRQIADAEANRPRWLPTDSPVWAAMGVEPHRPGTPARAEQPSLEQELARLRALPLELDAPTPPVADAEAAGFLLDNARQRLDTDPGGALDTLDRAAELDASNPAIHDARAQALIRLGRRTEAGLAARLGAAMGSTDPVTLTLFGLDLSAEGSHEQAARALARAADDDSADPVTRAIALATIGQALLELGADRAGAEAIRAALTEPPRPEPDTLLRADLIRVLGRRAALLRQAGAPPADTDPLAAGPTPDTEIARLVSVGRPTQAVLRSLDDVRASQRPLRRAERTLIRSLAQDGRLRPALARALRDAAATPGLGPTAHASLLTTAADLLPLSQANDILLTALRTGPFNETIARALLASDRAPIDDRLALAESIVQEAPDEARRVAAALLVGPTPPAQIRERAHARPEPHPLLLGAIDLQLRRPRDAFDRLANTPTPPNLAARLLQTEAAVAIGRWDVATQLADAVDPSTPSPSALRLLRAAHRFEAAATMGEALPLEDQLDTDLLLELAELGVQLGRPRDAELYLAMAEEHDPFDERVLAAKLAIYAPGAALESDALHTQALRSLRERTPDGLYASMLAAQDLASSGILDEAERRLRAVVERDPEQRAAFELLHQLWLRKTPEARADALAWLGALVEGRPGSPTPAGALARLLANEDRIDEAMEALDACEQATAAPVMARLRERLLREADRADEANTLARARLDTPTRSIDESLELAEIELADAQTGPARAALVRDLPDGVALTGAQQRRMLRLCSLGVATISVADLDDPDLSATGRDVLTLIELTRERVPALPWPLHNARLTFTAFDPESDVEAIFRVCEDARPFAPDDGREAYRAAIRPLIARERTSDAIELATRAAVRSATLDEELLTDAVSVSAQAGSVEDTARLIDALEKAGMTRDAVRMLRPEPDTPLDAPESQRAEIAYQIGSIATYFGRDAFAEQAYRLALRHDPAHAWTNNDLGYMLVDTGSDIGEGETLIARAYEALPDSPNVTDSLAWARYKLGWFEDQPDRPGAITLLRRAIELQVDGDRGNATLHDHLGDALYRVGQIEEATESWLNAEAIALEQTRSLRRDGASASAIERLENRLRSVRRKLRALQADETPPVAPLGEGVSPPDAPDNDG